MPLLKIKLFQNRIDDHCRNDEYKKILQHIRGWNLATHDPGDEFHARLHEIWDHGVQEGSDIDIDEYKEFKIEWDGSHTDEEKSFADLLEELTLDGQQDALDLWELKPGQDLKVSEALITRTK